MVTSEASYLRSLRLLTDTFVLSQALRDTLTPRDHHTLFSNVQRVQGVSERSVGSPPFCWASLVSGESTASQLCLRGLPSRAQLFPPEVRGAGGGTPGSLPRLQCVFPTPAVFWGSYCPGCALPPTSVTCATWCTRMPWGLSPCTWTMCGTSSIRRRPTAA